MSKTNRVKVVLWGEEGCGKTCLIKAYCESKFDATYNPTIGVDYGLRYESVPGGRLQLNIFDLSGDGAYLPICEEFLPGAHALLLCYTAGKFSAGRMKELDSQAGCRRGAPCFKVLIACKRDLGGVDKEGPARFCQENGYVFFAISAKEPGSVKALFKAITDKFKQTKP